MARPYNIRSRYGPNEPTGPERFANTITSGLDAIVAEQEARRADDNEMRRRGGVQVGTPPSAGDRFNAVKRGVGRVFGRGGPPSEFVGDATLPPPSVPMRSGPLPSSSVSYGNSTMQLPTQVQRPKSSSPIASALGDDLSYEETGRSGKRFKFDPLRIPRAEMAMKEQATARDHTDKMAEIAAENASREKIAGINANQRITSTSYSYDQRKQIAAAANASHERAAGIIASGRANSAEGRQAIQQAILDLREAGLAMQAAGLESAGYENAAKALEAKIPTGTNLIVEQSTPAGAARIDSARTNAAAMRDSARAVRTRGAGAARSVLAGSSDTTRATKTPTAAQLARAARDPQYRQFLIETGYKVP